MNLLRIISASSLALVSTQASADALNVGHAAPLSVWICAGAATIVFSAILISVFAYRPSTAADAGKAPLKTARETIWALVPIAIVIGAATPALTSMPNELEVSASQQTARATARCTVLAKPSRSISIAAVPDLPLELSNVSISSCPAQR